MMKFIHCADVHLDTPLQGLAQYPGAPVHEIRNATRRAFEKVIDAALLERIDFLIIAGDLYDVGLKSFESALFFNKQMSRLDDAGIDVYLIYGNHDAASKLIKQVRPPANVYVFKSNAPETFTNDDLHVAIHGQSFATPEVMDDLAANYPPPMPHYFNIGVLHTNLSGSAEHANYAPCTLESLKNKGYQYWALGHVHNREILCTDPYIVYPGNIQGRHGKEPGEKSCELVTVSDTFAVSLRTIPTSVASWIEVELDASGCGSANDVFEKMSSVLGEVASRHKGRVTAVRLRITSETDSHLELSRDPEQTRNEAISAANACSEGLLWIERVGIETRPKLDREALLHREDPIGEVARTAALLRGHPEGLAQWNVLEDLIKKLPAELCEGEQSICPDAEALSEALQEAESMLLARLATQEPA